MKDPICQIKDIGNASCMPACDAANYITPLTTVFERMEQHAGKMCWVLIAGDSILLVVAGIMSKT